MHRIRHWTRGNETCSRNTAFGQHVVKIPPSRASSNFSISRGGQRLSKTATTKWTGEHDVKHWKSTRTFHRVCIFPPVETKMPEKRSRSLGGNTKLKDDGVTRVLNEISCSRSFGTLRRTRGNIHRMHDWFSDSFVDCDEKPSRWSFFCSCMTDIIYLIVTIVERFTSDYLLDTSLNCDSIAKNIFHVTWMATKNIFPRSFLSEFSKSVMLFLPTKRVNIFFLTGSCNWSKNILISKNWSFT